MQFEFSQEFDVPLAGVEQALMSAELLPLLGRRLASVCSIDPRSLELEDGVLSRVWRFQARKSLPMLPNRVVSNDMMVWDEHWSYRLADHSARWFLVPRPEAKGHPGWRRRFVSTGGYELQAMDPTRTRLAVAGGLQVDVPLVGRAVERFALRELRNIHMAEVETLRALCNRS